MDINHTTLFPQFMNQLVSGFVSNIVITSSTSANGGGDESMISMKKKLRMASPHASIVLCEGSLSDTLNLNSETIASLIDYKNFNDRLILNSRKVMMLIFLFFFVSFSTPCPPPSLSAYALILNTLSFNDE
jgi:hypothetical protein